MTEFVKRVADVVRKIPKGQVSSYGQVAQRAGKPGAARQVAKALGQTKGLPWWRVIQSAGTLAPAVASEQRKRLRAEGVTVRGRRVVVEDD